MELTNFLENLNDFCEELDSEYNINSGGCCFVAYILAQCFEKYNINYRICIADYCGYFDYEDFLECLEERDGSCECCGLLSEVCHHYFLIVDDLMINSDGEDDINNEALHVLPQWLDSHDLEWIYDTGDWNEEYDPDNNEYIEDQLNSFFDEAFREE